MPQLVQGRLPLLRRQGEHEAGRSQADTSGDEKTAPEPGHPQQVDKQPDQDRRQTVGGEDPENPEGQIERSPGFPGEGGEPALPTGAATTKGATGLPTCQKMTIGL